MKITSQLLLGFISLVLMGGLLLYGMNQAEGRPQDSFPVFDVFNSTRVGDVNDVTIENLTGNSTCHSHNNCTKISYSAKGRYGWAGIYWLYPAGNWIGLQGRDLSPYRRVTFWAKGEKGGEWAEFKVGGWTGDSIQPEKSTGAVILTPAWTRYAIDLSNRDLRKVIAGFCWVTDAVQNPNGCTIYLDDVVYEE